MTQVHDRPLVSVVIPCFNQAHYLSAAIVSVLRQEYPAFELIVVDDGSSDGTHEIAQGYGIRTISQPNLGTSAARNAGLRAATGDFVIFLDADDELLPGAIESGVEMLSRNEDAICVVRRCRLIDGLGRPLHSTHQPVDTRDLYREWLLRNFVWTPGAAVFRRDPLVRMNGFPEDLSPAADYAVYLLLSRMKNVVADFRDVVLYRQHEGNMSRDAARMLSATLEVLRRERPNVPSSHAAEFAIGRRAWRRFYGDQIIDRLRTDVRKRAWTRWHLAAVWTLARHAPEVLWGHLLRKVSRVVRQGT